MIKYELKKIFSKKTNKAIVAATVFISIWFSILAVNSVVYVDENGIENRNFYSARKVAEMKNTYKGELTSDVLRHIVLQRQNLSKRYPDSLPNTIYAKELQPYNDIVIMINGMLKSGKEYDHSAILQVDLSQVGNLYEARDKNIKLIIDEYGETNAKKDFLEKIYASISTPFYYEANDSWTTMIRYVSTVGMIVVLLITIPGSSVFSDEFQTNNVGGVFFSSRFGRSKAIKVKILSGIIVTTAIYWGSMMLLSLISFSIMGISGYNVPHQFFYSYSIYDITIFHEYCIILICGYIASLLSAAISMLISARAKTGGLSIGVPFLIFAVSPFVGRILPFKTFFQLTPDQLMNVDNCLRIPYIYQVGNIVFRQIPFIMCLYTLLSVLIFFSIYKYIIKENS